MTLQAPVSWGELIDKITILEIKQAHISDPAKLANVNHEHDVLTATRDQYAPFPEGFDSLVSQLKDINQKLWDIEDDIRDQERKKQFGEEFIRLARAVYFTNDIRADLKKQINTLLGSDLVEEKSYQDYS